MEAGQLPVLWLTRPEADSQELAAALAPLGFSAHIDPLITAEFAERAPPIDWRSVDTLLVTSRNGLRALIRHYGAPNCRVYAVGEQTAALAKAAGFADVLSADGDAADLAALIRQREPASARLLHITGVEQAQPIGSMLRAGGFFYQSLELYKMVPKGKLLADTLRLLREQKFYAIAFFSPRTAQAFVDLFSAQKALAESLKTCHALCLSPAVAAPLSIFSWRGIRIADHPSRKAWLALLT